MKILFLIDSLRSGGKERQLVETLKFLATRNDITCELVLMAEEVHYSYIEDLQIPTHQIMRKYKNDPSIFFKFYKLFRGIKPDVVHSWSSMCSVYAVPAAKMIGVPFVNGFLRDAPLSLCIKDQAWRRAKLTFPLSDVIAANSYAGLEAYKVPKNKKACLHNGFDFTRTEGLADKETVKDQLGIHTPYVVGMVASFSEKKDYKTFIDAGQMVLEKRNDVTFAAIGDGVYLDTIQNYIKPELEDNFRLPGKQNRVLNVVNIFNICILSTYTEGISNAIMEYMALKKPAIVTDCGGNRELVENNHTGFLVEAENPSQIAEKILLLLENKDLAENMGQNGYEKLKNEFSLEVMGKAFLRLYQQLC